MKILIRNADHAAIHADDSMVLSATECRGEGWVDRNFSLSNATLQDAELPDPWCGAAWGYDEDGWFVIDHPRIDTLITEAAERKATEQRAAAKLARADTVERIKVTTTSGKTFDGDEISQGRMARGILGLQAAGAPSVTWVLADNTPTQVTIAELGEALALAGAAQAAAWVIS